MCTLLFAASGNHYVGYLTLGQVGAVVSRTKTLHAYWLCSIRILFSRGGSLQHAGTPAGKFGPTGSYSVCVCVFLIDTGEMLVYAWCIISS